MTTAGAVLRLIATLIVTAAVPSRAEDAMSGRWEGTARVPGDELTIVELSWVVTSPAVADGKVFFATSDSSLYHVVDANSGKPDRAPGGKSMHVFLAHSR